MFEQLRKFKGNWRILYFWVNYLKQTLPVKYKPKMLEPPSPMMANWDKGFSKTDMTNLKTYALSPPLDVMKGVIDGQIDIDE